jgi:hypothetical protein
VQAALEALATCQKAHPAYEHDHSCDAENAALTAAYGECDPSKGSCNLSTNGEASFGYWLAQIVYVFTVGLGSIVAALAAVVLNFIVRISLDGAAYGLDFVSQGWTIMRDLANMAFIFILVYIALQVMFQAQTHGMVERLAKVVAIALIINFSFFGTRVVIDMGNLLSLQFYNAIVDTTTTSNVTLAQTPFGNINSPWGAADLTKDIMGGINFVSGLNPSSFESSDAGNTWSFVTSFITFAFVYIILGAALFMLAAAFLAASIKFLVRIVMLWFAIITAPLALVMWAFQAGHGGGSHGHGFSFSSWLKNLLNHAFYPVVFLFVMLLISNFMGSLQTDAGGIGSTAVDAGSVHDWSGLVATLANIIVRLGFVIVMLYYAIKAGDYFEVAGSKVAEQFGRTFSLGGLTGYRQRLDWINNSIGPKRWAGGLDNQLKQGGLAGIGNTAIGYRLRQSVTKPLSEIKLKDMESRPEYVKRTEKEGKEMSDNLKHMGEHKSGPKAEAKAQRNFENKYEGGKAGFDNHMNELLTKLADQQQKESDLAEKTLELSKESFRTMTEAERENYNGRVKTHNDNVTAQKKAIKNTQDIIKTLKGMGARITDAHDKQHTQEIAIKLMSSKNGIKYAVGKQMLMGKSKEAKLADAAKELAEDGGGGDGHGEDGGGNHGGRGGGGGQNHSPTQNNNAGGAGDPADGHRGHN